MFKWAKKSLYTKLLVAFAGGGLIMFAVIGFLTFSISRQALVNSIVTSLLHLATAKANEMDIFLSAVARISGVLASTIEADTEKDEGAIKERVRRILVGNPDIYGTITAFEPYSFHSDQTHFSPYWYYDKGTPKYKRTLPADYNYWEITPKSDWYTQPRDVGKQVWSQPYYDEWVGDALMVTSSTPFYHDDGSFYGVATIDITLERLSQILQDVAQNQAFAGKGHALLVNQKGAILGIDDPTLIGDKLNDLLKTDIYSVCGGRLKTLAEKMVTGGHGIERLADPFHGQGEMFAVFAPLSVTGWAVVIFAPARAMMHELVTLRTMFILVTGVIILIVVGVVKVVAQSITSPVKKLTDAARIVANGNVVNWSNASSEDEIGLLTNSFQQMQEAINEKIQNLEKEIAERKKAEASLRASEEKQKAILEATPDPVAVYDAIGYPIYLNPAFTELFGWSVDELNGKLIPFVPRHQEEFTKLKIKEIYETGNPVKFEAERLTKHGDIVNVLISAAIITDFEEKRSGMVVNIKDITDRKKLETQLRETQKMESIGTLAGGIAHDFNNILSPLVGYAEMLRDDIPPDNPQQKYINQIIQSAFRARDLVQQILTFSRRGDNQMKPMKLHPIVKEALKLLRASIPTNIDIHHDIDPGCGAVMADPTGIHQIVMNLATNAYHAMEKAGGRLDVGLKQVLLEPKPSFFENLKTGEYARLTVSDTGIGIEKDVLNKVFDPYFTTKAPGKGTGLGLSVVQGIVKSCNGVIRIESEPGDGTEIQIYLPVIALDSVEKSLAPVHPVQGGNERILLVDDEAAIVLMVQMMLEKLGYRVTTRTSSLEALAAFKASPHRFDLVITDMAMPNMTGDELARALRSINPGVPIIICTGFSTRIDEKSAAAMGVDGFLMKPVVKVELANRVRKVLDKASG